MLPGRRRPGGDQERSDLVSVSRVAWHSIPSHVSKVEADTGIDLGITGSDRNEW